MERKLYPSDLTDGQWKVLAPLLPTAKRGGRPRTVDLREVMNGILYVSDVDAGGGPCHMASGGAWQTVYQYLRGWKHNGKSGPRGYDAGKKVTGRKRHIIVDTIGLLLNVLVHPANIQDRDGANSESGIDLG